MECELYPIAKDGDTFCFDASSNEDSFEPDLLVYASDGSGSSAMFVSSAFMQSRGAFFGQMFGDGYTVSQNVPSPVAEDGTIIVQATAEQVAAAEKAFDDAGIIVHGGQILSVIAGAFAVGRAEVIAAGTAGVALGADEVCDFVADSLYYFDGMDGAYDGVYQGQHHYSILGGGGDIPDFPSH